MTDEQLIRAQDNRDAQIQLKDRIKRIGIMMTSLNDAGSKAIMMVPGRSVSEDVDSDLAREALQEMISRWEIKLKALENEFTTL